MVEKSTIFLQRKKGKNLPEDRGKQMHPHLLRREKDRKEIRGVQIRILVVITIIVIINLDF